MDEYYFEYIENISIKDRNLIPFITFYKNGQGIHPLSQYLYNLSNDEIEELDNLFNYSKKVSSVKDYNIVDRKIWLKYKISNGITINALNETIKKNKIKDNDNISVEYGCNGKFKTIDFPNNSYKSNNIKYKRRVLFKTYDMEYGIDNNVDEEPILFLHKAGTFKNNRELLYMILNCLFSSNNTYYLKKCELCNKYYITNKVNKRYCNRGKIVLGKQTTCCNSLNTFYKSKEYIKIRRLKNNHLSKYYKNNNEESIKYINNFLNKYNDIIDKCIKKRNIDDNDIKDINNLISNF